MTFTILQQAAMRFDATTVAAAAVAVNGDRDYVYCHVQRCKLFGPGAYHQYVMVKSGKDLFSSKSISYI